MPHAALLRFDAADLALCAAVPGVCLMDGRHIRCFPWQAVQAVEPVPGEPASAHHVLVKSGVNVQIEHFVELSTSRNDGGFGL